MRRRYLYRIVCLMLIFCVALAAQSCASAEYQRADIDSENELRICTTLTEDVYVPLVKEFAERTGIWPKITRVPESEIENAFYSPDYDFFLGGSSEYYENHSSAFSKDIPDTGNLYAGLSGSENTWFGFMTDPVVFIYSRSLGDSANAPSSWSMLGAMDKSEIALADPARSDTSLTAFAEMLQHCQQSEVNRFLNTIFDAGVTEYFSDTDEVAEAVATGRYIVGVVTESEAWKYAGSDIYIVYPSDGTIAVTGAAAIALNTENYAAAYAFAEFLIGSDAQTYLSSTLGIRPVNSTVAAPKSHAAYEAINITPYELGWVYARKMSILSYWKTLAGTR